MGPLGGYDMRILVVGAGKVGATLAEHLVQEQHDVTVIDSDEDVLEDCQDMMDIMCINGNGANAQTLIDAGVDKVDVLIAATAGDEVNMLCCLIGKRLGARYAIARIRDPQYNESLTLLQQELGIDMVINPERATALEISHLLRFPFASNIESFAKGRVEMVEFRAQPGDSVVGVPLSVLTGRHSHLPRVLYAAVERDGQVTIPSGDFIIRPGDRVFVTGDTVTVTSFFDALGKNKLRVKNVMILGGGRISYYLAKMIVPTGIHVTMVEINPTKAEKLSEELPHVTVLCGDGTNMELLEQEGVMSTDALVCLTDRDEENLMTGLFAAHQKVPKVIVKNNHLNYTDIISEMGLDSMVSPKQITSANILRYVRARARTQGTRVEKLYRVLNGKAEALEFDVRAGEKWLGIPLKNLVMRKNTLVAVIVRRGKVIVPFGNDTIEAGDSVVFMACESGIHDINQIIQGTNIHA